MDRLLFWPVVVFESRHSGLLAAANIVVPMQFVRPLMPGAVVTPASDQ
jgi:hypothetical protein